MFPGCQKAVDWGQWPEKGGRFFVEPKLDGYRLSAVVDSTGEVSFHCGSAKSPDWAENLEHIADAIQALPLRNVMIDGELLGGDWNRTASLVRRKRSKMDEATKAQIREELEFHIFDLVPLDGHETAPKPGGRKVVGFVPISFVERRKALVDALSYACESLEDPTALGPLYLVECFEVATGGELDALLKRFLADGYEGAMVKDPEAGYYFDRVSAWQKIKPRKTVEVIVLSAVEGIGKHEGRMGALVCLNDDGDELRVGGGFSDDERKRFWMMMNLEPERLHGLRIEVEMQDTDVAVARHANFVRERPLDC